MKKSNRILKAAFLIAAFALFIAAVPYAVKAAQITALSENSAPIAENLEFKTYKQIAITAPLRAIDPDGDLVRFSLTSGARKGSVELSGDSFTYTPSSGSKGTDSFSYVATDRSGAVSREASVTIDIKAASSGVSYSDMDGSSSAYAAQRLAEEGVFTGRKVSGSYFFDPGAAVSRGEFLAMCMNVAGMEGLGGVSRTGFYDDADIAAWAKPYISSALLAGVVQGYPAADGTVVFLPEQDITFSEAAVMLSGVLEISDVKSACNVPQSAVEAWAYQSVANLAACNVISSGAAYDGELTVTRADAAELLCAAMDLIEARESGERGFSLFGWVFG